MKGNDHKANEKTLFFTATNIVFDNVVSRFYFSDHFLLLELLDILQSLVIHKQITKGLANSQPLSCFFDSKMGQAASCFALYTHNTKALHQLKPTLTAWLLLMCPKLTQSNHF